jgi:hypothetical protein
MLKGKLKEKIIAEITSSNPVTAVLATLRKPGEISKSETKSRNPHQPNIVSGKHSY